VPRRCRPGSVTGLIGLRLAALVFAVFVALVPMRGSAQTATDLYDDELLQPSLSGNPANPPNFMSPGNGPALPSSQAPPTGRFALPTAAPSRIGATPVYGSPTGFGAGDTGFNSSNVPPKRPAQTANQGAAIAPASDMTFDTMPAPPPQVSSVPPALPQPPPPVVYPAKAAARPGAVLPPPPDQLPISNPPPVVYPLTAATRPGATLPIPPPQYFLGSASTPPPGTPPPNSQPLGTVPHPTLPIAAGDPYEALGIKAGSFLILPAVELSAGYNTNPQAAPNGPSSPYFVVAPELHVRSNWATNSFTADIISSYIYYANDSFVPPLSVPYVNAKVDGRLDVTRTTQILLEGRTIVSTDNPGSPNIQAGLAQLPLDTTVGATLGAAQQFGRLDVSLKGTVDRSMYSDAELTDGEIANFDYRNFSQYAGILRLGYQIDPGLKPFVEVDEDTRNYDLLDPYDENRSSDGSSAKFGVDLNLFGSLTGEIAAGYMERVYQDPTLPKIAGATLDGALIWQATALTTAKLTASSGVTESTVQGVSGELSRAVSLEVDHALRSWLIANVQFGYENDSYVGLDRDDNHYFAATGLTYKMNRELQLKGQVRQDWLTSNVSGAAYNATTFLLTMRLQK